MKRISIFLLVFFTISCGTTKYVPTDTKEVIVYRDSIVYVKDTISVPIPYEVVRETIPIIDTSIIKTSYAESVAYIDTTNRSLFHSLEQKGTIKAPIDTLIIVKYLDREIEKVATKEVEVETPKRDSLFWVLSGWAIICIIYAIFKIKFSIK